MMRRTPSSMAGAPTGRPRRAPPRKTGPSLSEQLAWMGMFLAVLCGLIWVLWPIFSILIAAATAAYLLDPMADKLEARGYKRDVGIGLIFACFALLISLFLFVMLPLMAAQFIELSANVRGYVDNLAQLVGPARLFIEEQTGHTIPLDIEELKAGLPDLVRELSPNARTRIQDLIRQVFASSLGVFTTIINLALLPVFTFYLLSEWDKMVGFVRGLVPVQHQPRVNRLAGAVDERLAAFVRGQLTVCAVLAVLYSLGLWAAGVDMAFAVGMLSGALFVVPYLGTVVGVLLGSVLCIMKYGVDIHLVYVALAFGVPQFIESWYLTPKVVGDKVGLHPLVVMIALLAGGGLAGIWGMLLAIPLTAVLDVLAREGLALYRGSSSFRGHSG